MNSNDSLSGHSPSGLIAHVGSLDIRSRRSPPDPGMNDSPNQIIEEPEMAPRDAKNRPVLDDTDINDDPTDVVPKHCDEVIKAALGLEHDHSTRVGETAQKLVRAKYRRDQRSLEPKCDGDGKY